jgi:hypothetical protein
MSAELTVEFEKCVSGDRNHLPETSSLKCSCAAFRSILRKDMQDTAGDTEHPRIFGRVPPSTAQIKLGSQNLSPRFVRSEKYG